MADTLAKFKATPWGIDFAAPEGTVAERLRKLTAIQERLRLAHNAEGYERKRWYEHWLPRFRVVGQHIAALRPTLPDPGRDAAGMMRSRFDRQAVKKTPEFAVLLSAVDLDKTFSGAATARRLPDPLEDFGGYTEVDPNGRFAIGAGGAANSKITVTGLLQNEDAYIYKDYGAAHFGTSFEHRFVAFQNSSSNNAAIAIGWAVSNVVEDLRYWADNNSQAIEADFYSSAGRLELFDTEGGDFDTHNGGQDTVWYCTADRDDGACDLIVRTGSHAGPITDTLAITLNATRTYRYVFGVDSFNAGYTRLWNGYFQDLDLQEAAALAFFPYHVRSNKKFHNSLILR